MAAVAAPLGAPALLPTSSTTHRGAGHEYCRRHARAQAVPSGSLASFVPPTPRPLCRRRLAVTAFASKGFGAAKGGGFGKKAAGKPAVDACPCGGGDEKLPYEKCCGPYHAGENPPTSVAMMKSRYSAYAKGLGQYVVDTTHPDNRGGTKTEKGQTTLEEDVQWMLDTFSYVGLEILNHEVGEADGRPAEWVSFRALVKRIGESAGSRKSRGKAKPEEMVERSRFVQEDGKWLYRAVDEDDERSRLKRIAQEGAEKRDAAGGMEAAYVAQPKGKAPRAGI